MRARARKVGVDEEEEEEEEGTGRMPRFLNRNYSQQNCAAGAESVFEMRVLRTRNTCGERYCLPGSKYDDREGRKLGK